MTDDSCRALLTALADAVTGAGSGNPAEVRARLGALSGPRWLRMDQLARCLHDGDSPLDGITDWSLLLSDADSQDIRVLVAASMARDGRVREAAVALLSLLPGPAASAALAVRTGDWVQEVRELATDAISARTAAADVAGIVTVLLPLRARWRGNLATSYLARLAAGHSGTLLALAADAADRACRLWALAALDESGGLPAGHLAAGALSDHDPVVALWCARRLMALPDGLPAETWQALACSSKAGLRALAVQRIPDDQLTRARLGELLLDGSGAVRSAARWRWSRRWGNLAPVYHRTLAAPRAAREIAAALEGLADDHDPALPDAAVPFLSHPSPRVRCAAAGAYGRHAGLDDVHARLAPLLLAGSPKVVAAALRFLSGPGLAPGVLDALDSVATPLARRTALRIRQRLGPWDRVHADLLAISGPDADLARIARDDLLNWLARGATTSYGHPRPGQGAEMARLLATSGLTDAERRGVAFAAGIRLAGARGLAVRVRTGSRGRRPRPR